MPLTGPTADVLSTVETVAADIEQLADDESPRQPLNELAVLLAETRGDADENVHRLVCEAESFSRQVCIHDDSDLGGHTVHSLLTEAYDLGTAYCNGDATPDDLTEHIDSTRDDILEHRADTNVIGEYGLGAAFDEAVESALADFRDEQ